jgi:hypothetical protein
MPASTRIEVQAGLPHRFVLTARRVATLPRVSLLLPSPLCCVSLSRSAQSARSILGSWYVLLPPPPPLPPSRACLTLPDDVSLGLLSLSCPQFLQLKLAWDIMNGADMNEEDDMDSASSDDEDDSHLILVTE